MDAALVIKRYPIEVSLEDGTQLTLRSLAESDKIPLAQFFQRISEEDRYYLKENVAAPGIILDWIDHMNLERAIPIVAEADGKIVADATLHRTRTPARRHIGELRLVVDSEFRGRGLGSRIIQELIDLSKALDLEMLVFELVDRREAGAIHAAVKAGFEEAAVLRNRVKDMFGSHQDLVILELQLEDDTEFGHF